VITALCWLGTALLLSLGMRTKAPQWKILMGLLAWTVLIKILFTALQFGAELSLLWLTAGAIWGMVLGSVILRWMLRCSIRTKFWAALVCLLSATVAISVLPDNPYFILTMRHWYQGPMLHFNDLMQWLSVLWLPLALFWMIREALVVKLKP
jgi:type IV secretory pathway TraG/TraD family ATPase VirD4